MEAIGRVVRKAKDFYDNHPTVRAAVKAVGTYAAVAGGSQLAGPEFAEIGEMVAPVAAAVVIHPDVSRIRSTGLRNLVQIAEGAAVCGLVGKEIADADPAAYGMDVLQRGYEAVMDKTHMASAQLGTYAGAAGTFVAQIIRGYYNAGQQNQPAQVQVQPQPQPRRTPQPNGRRHPNGRRRNP